MRGVSPVLLHMAVPSIVRYVNISTRIADIITSSIAPPFLHEDLFTLNVIVSYARPSDHTSSVYKIVDTKTV